MRSVMMPNTLILLLAASLLVTVPSEGHPGQHRHKPHIDTRENCGDSRTITVTCLVQSNAQRVLDIRLENADGGTSSVCGIGDLPGTTKLVYSLAPGDNIYGVQACYRRGVMVGVTFSSAGGPLMCGNPQDPDATCEATVAKELAPMAGISGQCNSDGITKITQVCFNPLYVNPIIPVVACPPGQGRLSAQEPCTSCPRNTYNPGGLQAECLPCPEGLATIAVGASRCGCPPGWGANPNTANASQPCAECPPGSYYPGGNVEPCWRCRGSAFMTSPKGAASIVQCVCRPGYGASVDAPNTCQPCPKGTWSNSLADVTQHAPFDSLVRFPPGTGNGKGKGGCYTCNPSWKECTSCCAASLQPCNLTTATPGASSSAACRPVG